MTDPLMGERVLAGGRVECFAIDHDEYDQTIEAGTRFNIHGSEHVHVVETVILHIMRKQTVLLRHNLHTSYVKAHLEEAS